MTRVPKRGPKRREEPATAGERKLERLKRSVLIAELVKQSGIALTPQGPLRLGACPYHEDKGASLVLNTKANTWRCEPCKAGGDVIAWVQKRDALDFVDALDVIKGMVARGEAAEPTEATTAPTKHANLPAISSSLAAELAAPERKGPWSRRIPEEEVERIKRDVSILRLVEAEGVKLSGHGDNRIGLCPLHDDKNPSLVVSPQKNVWHCFGACQAGGSVIDWVMRAKRVSFRLALQMLRDETPSLTSHVAGTRPKLEPLAQPKEPDRVVLQRVVNFYAATAKASPELLAYLEHRGLVHGALLETFKLGYANRTLGHRLPQRQVKEGEALRSQLQRIGVFNSTGHERLAGSLTIPVFAEDGEVLELYGRKIHDHLRKGTSLHLYLPARADGRRGVFNLPAVKASREVILCEALIDALTFWCAGFRNVTSAYGVEGFTNEHRAALLEHKVERVLIAYDADDAGDRAAEKLAKDLGAEGLEVFRVRFPKGMDANEYARAVKPADKALETAIRGAVRMAGPEAVVVPHALEAPAPTRTELETMNDATPSDPREPAPVEAAQCPQPAAGAAPPAELDAGNGSASPTRAEAATAEHEPAPTAAALTHDEGAGASPIVDENPSQAVEATSSAAERATPTATPAQAPAPSDRARDEPLSLVADGAATLAPRAEPARTLVDAEVAGDEARIRLGDRRWRIRGLSKARTYDSLHINLLVARGDDFFVDNLELYSARARAAFVKDAAKALKLDEDTVRADVGRIVLKLEDLVHQRIAQALERASAPKVMTEAERAEASALLKDPKRLERIVEDFDRAGVVGEATNLLIGYLAAVSRKLETPLAVVIQSSSAAGKSSLMDMILRFMPEEERVQYSAMTGQSLFYLGETDLQHKILAIAEEEGAQSAAYALKLLQSEGELTIASTGKDPATGKHVTHPYHVRGPVMIFLTTTAIEVDEELLNRCLVLTVDEGPKQTAAIHERQRELQTLEGLFRRRSRDELVQVHQNAQRLLEPLPVVNPLAKTLLFSNQATRSRRDHMKYLTLIQCVALLHQHQRPVKEAEHGGKRLRYIEATPADVEIAKRLAAQVLESSDELPPQTRRLLALIDDMVKAEATKQGIGPSAVRFSRKDIRNHTRWSDAALKKHLSRLEDLEHLVVHAGGTRRRFVYELATQEYDGHLVTPSGNWSPPGHPLVTPGGCPDSSAESRANLDLVTPPAKTQIRPATNGVHPAPSYGEVRS